MFEFMITGVNTAPKAGLRTPKKLGNSLDEAIEKGSSLVDLHGFTHTEKTAYDLVKGSPLATKFVELVDKFDDIAKLLKSTSVKGTVFVPLNSAFAKIPEGAPEISEQSLRNVLLYHISPEYYLGKDLIQKHTIPTLLSDADLSDDEHDGQRLAVHDSPSGLTLGYYSRVVGSDVIASNGVLHAIDSIIFPPPTAAEVLDFLPTKFSTFELGLLKSGLYFAVNDTNPKNHLGGTIFAPTNTAFELLGPTINAFLFSRGGAQYLRALLRYHLVPDETLYSDFLYDPTGIGKSLTKDKDIDHVELPTLLNGKLLRVDRFNNGVTVLLVVNTQYEVTEVDGIANNGVIQTLAKVLIPPKTSNNLFYPSTEENLSVEELKERLEPLLDI